MSSHPEYVRFFLSQVEMLPKDHAFVNQIHSDIYTTLDPSHNEHYTSCLEQMITFINSVLNGVLSIVTNSHTGICSNIHTFVNPCNRRISMSIMGALGTLFVRDNGIHKDVDIHSYISNNPIPVGSDINLWSGKQLEYRIAYCKWIKNHLEILQNYPLMYLSEMIERNRNHDVTLPSNDMTTIFCYEGYLCINSSISALGLLNTPTSLSEIGFVIDANCVKITQEAINVLKSTHKCSSNLGDMDCYSTTNDTNNIVLSWVGGPNRIFDMYDVDFRTARLSNFSLLTPSENITPSPVFKSYIDGILETLADQ